MACLHCLIWAELNIGQDRVGLLSGWGETDFIHKQCLLEEAFMSFGDRQYPLDTENSCADTSGNPY